MNTTNNSYKIVINGSKKVSDYIQELRDSGELAEILGVSYIDLEVTTLLESGTLATDSRPSSEQVNLMLSQAIKEQLPVNLSEWFKGLFTSGWQAINAFLDSEKTLAYNPLSHSETDFVEGGKSIIVESNIGQENTVLLTIKIQPIGEEVEIKAKLQSTGGQKYLPSNLKLARLSKLGEVKRSVQSKEMDNFIQIEFTGKSGGHFGIQVTYGNATLIEEYFIA